jgi:hypothetical protein
MVWPTVISRDREILGGTLVFARTHVPIQTHRAFSGVVVGNIRSLASF